MELRLAVEESIFALQTAVLALQSKVLPLAEPLMAPTKARGSMRSFLSPEGLESAMDASNEVLLRSSLSAVSCFSGVGLGSISDVPSLAATDSRKPRRNQKQRGSSAGPIATNKAENRKGPSLGLHTASSRGSAGVASLDLGLRDCARGVEARAAHGGVPMAFSESSSRGASMACHVASVPAVRKVSGVLTPLQSYPVRGGARNGLRGGERRGGKQPVSLQQHLLAGGLAGMASRTATAPLETLRLRMMTGGGGGGGQRATVAGIARELWREAGWRAFFRGNLLNVLRAAPQKAIDFCAFEGFKTVLHASFPHSPMELRLAASGALAGGLSTLVLYPLDSVRSRMVVRRGAAALKFRSVPHAFATITRTEGLGSLYRGLAPSLLSILPEAAITYGFHDLFKMAYQKATGKETVGPMPALACGVSSAFLGQMVAYPLEVVARQAQVATTRQSMAKTLQKILETQGPGGLYSGIVPATVKLIPMAMISFGVYESAKLLLAQAESLQEQPAQTDEVSA